MSLKFPLSLLSLADSDAVILNFKKMNLNQTKSTFLWRDWRTVGTVLVLVITTAHIADTNFCFWNIFLFLQIGSGGGRKWMWNFCNLFGFTSARELTDYSRGSGGGSRRVVRNKADGRGGCWMQSCLLAVITHTNIGHQQSKGWNVK